MQVKYYGPFLAVIIIFILYYWFRPITIETFQDAKEILESSVYYDHRLTIYCNVQFDANKNVKLPSHLYVTGKRAKKMEWEHAVPAAHFGSAFSAWKDGHPECKKNGKSYAGRKCAEKVSAEFRQMERDMYNLFPSVGAINASRGDKLYAELPLGETKFGSCPVKVDKRYFEPPDAAKGRLARASLYMDWRYAKFTLKPDQKKLFTAWDRAFPVSKWECTRTKRIEKIQGNENPFVKKKCKSLNLW